MSKPQSRPLIIAHRGSSHVAPENTLAAFEAAVTEGSEGIEMDVGVTRDGVPVVFHDLTLKRMTGEDCKISDLDLKSLSQVSVGSWFNRRYPNRARKAYGIVGVPTLAEALKSLEILEGPVYIELKCRESDMDRCVEPIARALADSPLFPQIIFKSFLPDAILFMREVCPGVSTAALFAPKVMSIIRKEQRLVNIAVDLGADMVSVHSALATKKLIKRARRSGLAVTIWTVDNPRWMKRAVELGVDAVITNKPAKMLLKRRQILHRNSITA
jgi:glycerophosphoryl diester phosphodiesterase